MTISAKNTNPYYQEYINSSSDVNSVRKVNESKFQNEEKNSLKYSTKDQMDAKVSEKNDDKRTIHDYNLPLQHNVPAAKLLKILKTFNETKKANSTSDTEYVDFIEIDNSPEKSFTKSPDEIGYYIVIDDRKTNNSVKRLKKFHDPCQERINKAYHLGFRKEPGTLVNVVV